MDGQEKRFLHHWRKKRVKTWQLIAALLSLTMITVYFLRQNNLKMVELRNLVVQADEQNGDVSGALQQLNQHVFKHMNTEIVRPVELVGSYNRQAQAVIAEASKGSGRDIYAEATGVCERRGIPLTSVAQCIADYAANNNPALMQKQLNLPDKELFIHTFATPRWTPDAAGFSVLITGVILLWVIARAVEYILVRLVIRRRLKNGF